MVSNAFRGLSLLVIVVSSSLFVIVLLHTIYSKSEESQPIGIQKPNRTQTLQSTSYDAETVDFIRNQKTGYRLYQRLNQLNKSAIDAVLRDFFFVEGRRANWMDLSQHNGDFDVKGVFTYPDRSYSRMSSYGSFSNVLFGTYSLQRRIWSIQHPASCADQRFMVLTGSPGLCGHGSFLTFLADVFGFAYADNRTVVVHPDFRWIWSQGSYCRTQTGLDCFFENMSSCYLSRSELRGARSWNYRVPSGSSRILLARNSWYSPYYPNWFLNFMNAHNFSLNDADHFWRTQILTYVMRPNERTVQAIQKYPVISNSNSNVGTRCIHVWVRHGDKGGEMELISPENYTQAIDFLAKSSMFDNNFHVFLSTDDQSVVDYFWKSKYTVKMVKFPRINANLSGNAALGDVMTLQILADTFASLQCDAFIGTSMSNIDRIVNYLRATFGKQSNAIYLENGNYNCLHSLNCTDTPFAVQYLVSSIRKRRPLSVNLRYFR